MKIDLTQINQDNFTVIENIIAGDRCYLVVPKKSYYGWSRDTLHLRSSIWNEAGEPVSLSFKKFFNWGERDELTYTPFSMTANGGVSVLEKLDGSTLIISKYKGEVIHRTRGTFDARNLPNGFEIGILKSKYPQFFDGSWYTEPTCPFSLIFEWTSPTNQIVIPHAEPEMHLLAIVNHADYTMHSQEAVDLYAKNWNLKRPKRLKFTKIKEMIEAIGAMRDFEGVCVYCNRDQDIRKIKTEYYLKLHAALTKEFGSFESVVDFYFENSIWKTYNEVFSDITKLRDYEIALHLQGTISIIVDGMKDVAKAVSGMQTFVNSHSHLSRKNFADVVYQAYGKTNKAGMCFTLYDKKPLTTDNLKKLFYQAIKK